jgi:LacI family transcriptional regulator
MTSITDVARQAKVSITTVSRVLNSDAHPVSEQARMRVLKATEELGYSPSALAKAMVTRSTNIVGVIVGDTTDPYFASIVRGVEDVARLMGYLVIVCNSDRVPDIEIKYLTTLHDYRVDGVIFAGGGLVDERYLSMIGPKLESFRNRGAAIVTMGSHLFPSLAVEVDNSQAVQDATEYLISLGHHSIAYISGPTHVTTSELRFKGYCAALESHHLEINPGLILPGNYSYDSGLIAAHQVVSLSEKPTAILASNDMMAIGCAVGLRNEGWRIPQDVSLMGIDDITPAVFIDPPLSTIALPLYEQGAKGMEYLVKLRNGEVPPNQTIMLPHKLIVRTSTAPPLK